MFINRLLKPFTAPTQLPQNRFFIITLPRSGSTWLQQTLDAHPDITCFEEPSNNWLSKAWYKSVEVTRNALPLDFYYSFNRLDKKLAGAGTRLTGAKLTQIQFFRHFDSMELFYHYQNAKVILMVRNSYTDAYCSRLIAHRYRMWHSSSVTNDKIKPFAVDTAQAERYVIKHMLGYEMIRFGLEKQGIEHMTLVYEDWMADIDNTMQTVAKFLDVEGNWQYSPLIKLVKQPYSELVTNYAELQEIEYRLKQAYERH